MDPQIILIALTVAGAIFVSLLGWAESGEPFDLRKFGASMGRAIFAGFASALIFEGTENITLFTYLSALLIGAGIDVAGHRAVRAFDQIRSNT